METDPDACFPSPHALQLAKAEAHDKHKRPYFNFNPLSRGSNRCHSCRSCQLAQLSS